MDETTFSAATKNRTRAKYVECQIGHLKKMIKIGSPDNMIRFHAPLADVIIGTEFQFDKDLILYLMDKALLGKEKELAQLDQEFKEL